MRRGLRHTAEIVTALAALAAAGCEPGGGSDDLAFAFRRPVDLAETRKADTDLRGRALKVLMDLARSRSAGVRVIAAEGLGRSRSKSAAGVLERLTADASASVRAKAAVALASVGSDVAADRLLAMLCDPAREVRSAAASGLEAVSSEKVAREFERLMLRPGPAGPRATAALALGRVGSTGSEALLANITTSDEPELAAAAAAALAHLGDGRGLAALSRFAKPTHPLAARLTAAEGLSRLGSPVAALHLRGMLGEDPSAEVRAAAARGLGITGAKGSVWQLLGAVRDRSARVRIAAAEALGSLGNQRPETVKVLTDGLVSGPVWAKAHAAKALGSIRAPAAKRALAEAAKSPDGLVAVHALGSLTKIGVPGSSAKLRRFLGSADSSLRAEAATIIGRVGLRTDVGELARLLDDRERHVRAAGAAAIMRLLAPPSPEGR